MGSELQRWSSEWKDRQQEWKTKHTKQFHHWINLIQSQMPQMQHPKSQSEIHHGTTNMNTTTCINSTTNMNTTTRLTPAKRKISQSSEETSSSSKEKSTKSSANKKSYHMNGVMMNGVTNGVMMNGMVNGVVMNGMNRPKSRGEALLLSAKMNLNSKPSGNASQNASGLQLSSSSSPQSNKKRKLDSSNQ